MTTPAVVAPKARARTSVGAVRVHFRSIDDRPDGAAWRDAFEHLWPSYRRWYLSEGDSARPGFRECERALEAKAPELLDTWRRLVGLAGETDLAARFLSQWCPPPALAGCSQAVLNDREPVLVRNYDHAPRLCEGIVLRSSWLESPVIGVTDCLIGALDGVNASGLCVALAFGGDPEVGEGFSAPLIVRLLLETCGTTAEAVARLRHVRPYLTYTFTLLDSSGDHATVFAGPRREPSVSRARHSTNHQEKVRWKKHAELSATRERDARLAELLTAGIGVDGLVSGFLAPPLRSTNLAAGFCTLYTAVYRPASGRLDLTWPHVGWRLELDDFPLGTVGVTLGQERA